MFHDEDLLNFSVDELRELAVYYPINQMVRVLNKISLKPIIPSSDEPSDYYTCYYEMMTKLSEVYRITERSIGPGSWFYEFIGESAWDEYIKNLKEKNNEFRKF